MSKSFRAQSPEFSEDGERAAQARGRYAVRESHLSREERSRREAIYAAGVEAAWRAYPERVENPRRPGTVEHAEWQSGADSSYEWAKVHEEEGWYRVVDGVEVQP